MKNIIFLLFLTLTTSLSASAATTEDEDILIVTYSRTGKSILVSDLLARHLDADTIRLIDSEDRSGLWGYVTAMVDTWRNNHTTIEPAGIDLAKYSTIILVSPIWGGKLSVATRTFLHNYQLKGKKVLLFTTGNSNLYKYENYDDNASFMKRYFRDFMRKKRSEMEKLTKASGAQYLDHYSISTRDVSTEKISERTKEYLCKGQQSYSWLLKVPLPCK